MALTYPEDHMLPGTYISSVDQDTLKACLEGRLKQIDMCRYNRYERTIEERLENAEITILAMAELLRQNDII